MELNVLRMTVMYNLRYTFDIIMRVLYVRLLRESEIHILWTPFFFVMKCFIDPVCKKPHFITILNGFLRQKRKNVN